MEVAFLKEETFDNRTQVTFRGEGELKIYIPKSYFNTKYAIELGSKLKTLGVFVYEYRLTKYLFLLPVQIEVEFSEKDKYKGKLKDETPNDEYDVFILHHGDAFIYNINKVQDLDDAELGINKIFIGGKIPNFLSYDQAYTYITNLLVATGITDSLNVSSVIIEFMMCELYRNRTNTYDAFRKYVNGNPNANLYNYKMVNMTATPALHSTFNTLTGQDAYQQILNAILRQRSGAVDIESPMEKLLKL